MEHLKPEERQFLEELAGQRKNNPAVQALREDILALSKVREEIAKDDGTLSSAQEARRERLLARLKREGLLPVEAVASRVPPAPAPAPAPKPAANPLSGLLGWLGIHLDGGSGGGLVVSPATALAMAVVAGGVVHAFYQSQSTGATRGLDPTRGGELVVEAANPETRCRAIEAALIATGLKKGTQVVASIDSQAECRVAVIELNEVAERNAAAAVFNAIGLEVEPQGRLELKVRKPR